MKHSRTISSTQEELVSTDPAGLVERVTTQAEPTTARAQPASSEAEAAETRVPNPHIKTVSVQYGRKLNLGDFNSAEISVTIWADLDEDEDAQAALDVLYAQAKDNVKKQAMPLLKAEPISLNYRESFMGVPVSAGEPKKEK